MLRLLRHGFAVGLHVHSQTRFVFFSVSCFVEQGLSHEQENRFSSEDKGKGKFPLHWSIFPDQKLQNSSQICHVNMKSKETRRRSLSCLFCVHNFAFETN